MEAATSNRVLIIVFVCIANQFLSDTEVGSPGAGGGGVTSYKICPDVCVQKYYFTTHITSGQKK